MRPLLLLALAALPAAATTRSGPSNPAGRGNPGVSPSPTPSTELPLALTPGAIIPLDPAQVSAPADIPAETPAAAPAETMAAIDLFFSAPEPSVEERESARERVFDPQGELGFSLETAGEAVAENREGSAESSDAAFGALYAGARRPETRAAVPGATPSAPRLQGGTREALRPLRQEGWAVLPPGMVSDDVEASVRAHAGKLYKNPSGIYDSLVLFNTRGWEKTPQLKPEEWAALDDAPIRALAEQLTPLLHEALPDEEFALSLVSVRRAAGTIAEGDEMHVDGGYLTVTIAFSEPEEAAGAGTVLYIHNGRTVEVLRVPARAMAVISGDEREASTGRWGTLHGAPYEVAIDRRLLILKYRRKKLVPEETRQRIDARTKTARETLERRRMGIPSPVLLGGWWDDFVGRMPYWLQRVLWRF